MAYLTDQDLDELDTRLDTSIKGQPSLSLPRDVALIHLLRRFEAYLWSPHFRSSEEQDPPEAHRHHCINGQDAMHFAVSWIFQHCPDISGKPQVATQEHAWQSTSELFESAMRYKTIWDYMSMCRRKHAIADRASNGTIRLRYVNQRLHDFHVANRFISTPDSPEDRRRVVPFDLSEVITGVRPRHHRGRIKYIIPPSTYEQQAEILRDVQAHIWELDPSWDLGGYTLGQFQKFWLALSTLCGIHFLVCVEGQNEIRFLDNVVMAWPRKHWVNELSRWNRLRKDIASMILDDLIYDPGLYGPRRKDKKKEPDVTYQPVFDIGSGLLAVSNSLVLLSNAERNIWDLVSIKRPHLHSPLQTRKEALWLQELLPRLESYGLRGIPRIHFAIDGRSSDLDLLILDDRCRFGLASQLKWRMNPDAIKEVVYTDGELQKGLDQAALSLQWLNARPRELQQVIALSAAELAEYEFQALVVSKNSLGSGQVHRAGIPIINERLLHWVLGAPHHRNVRTLWQVGEERRYMPNEGKHYKCVSGSPIASGGIHFLAEGIGVSLYAFYHEDKDIDFTGLS